MRRLGGHLLAWAATSAAGAFPGTAALVVAFQREGGSLEAARTLDQRTGLNVGRLAIADLAGDGRADLVMLGSENQALVMYQSATVAGSFTAPQPLR